MRASLLQRILITAAITSASGATYAGTWEACTYAIQNRPFQEAKGTCGQVFASVEDLARKSPADYEKVFEPLFAAVVDPALYPKGQQVEQIFLAALKDWEVSLGPEHTYVAALSFALAIVYEEQRRFRDAESLLTQINRTAERLLGSEHPHVASVKAQLASLYMLEGRFVDSESMHKQALAIRERAFGPNHPQVADSLNGLGRLYAEQHRLLEAEPLYKRALAIREQALGPDHEDVATSLNNLATVLDDQLRLREAEQLHKRAVTIRTKILGPEHRDTANSLNNLAANYDNQWRLNEAESLHKRALQIWEKTWGPEHPDVATSLNNLAANYNNQGRFAEAERLHLRALTIRVNAFGPQHPHVANSLGNLASNYASRGRYEEAENLLEKALEIRKRSLGDEHPDVVNTLGHLQSVYREQGKTQLSLDAIREASRIVHKRLRYGAEVSLDLSKQLQEMKLDQVSFHVLVSTLHAAHEVGLVPDVVSESFKAGQLGLLSSTGSAVTSMSSRRAAGDNKRSVLLRSYQDAQAKWKDLDNQLIANLYRHADQHHTEEVTDSRAQLALLERSIESLRHELLEDFPEYAELIAPEPLTIDQTKKLLRRDEAILMFSLGHEESFVWLVTKGEASFRRIPLGWEKFSDAVKAIRRPAYEIEATGGTGALRPMDIVTSHWLYLQLVEPFAAQLNEVSHLIVVPDRALHSVPFGMLVRSLPTTPIQNSADHAKVDWLIKRYAISVIPDVSALKALRAQRSSPRLGKTFLGFGDPDFQGDAGTMRMLNRGALFGSSLANPGELRSQLAPLPETRQELIALANTFGVNPTNSLFLRERATETNVKLQPLDDYEVIAFATHGLITGEMKGLVEPALALTPPKVPSEEDDGLLRASEIAHLKMNADLVILSACNTAASDGTPGAQGLSGLARAFFFAGAKSLMVTAWSVESESAQRLTTGMVKAMKASPMDGKAAAMRKAVLVLMNDPDYAHPYFWAPFIVVGDGR